MTMVAMGEDGQQWQQSHISAACGSWSWVGRHPRGGEKREMAVGMVWVRQECLFCKERPVVFMFTALP